MPRARDPNRDKAFEIWKQHKGEIKLKDIAAQLGVSEGTVRGWKTKDNWDGNSNGTLQKKIRSAPKKKKVEPVIESDELNEKQKLFCLYYLKYFNATKAYQKAYGCDYFSAKAHGYKLLQNVAVKEELERLNAERQQEILLGKNDILQKYIDIAFADITDFVDFGQEKRPELDHNLNPIIDENGEEVTYSYSYVNLKNHNEVDGTIITEVKRGKDGVSVKLADKMKALDMLTKYFDFLPEHQKRRLEEEKIKVEIEKVQGDKGASEDWVAALKEVAEKRKQVKANE
ncbi:terminase small subunit [Mesobacillus subterraneus]|uniref:terminase small subunit n=1 Tax=Mesobacillus subterraneus TaxID=285983 RepID=UPI00203A5402|nr:terminase small subunit [Mesobacillus subterraneus]MCM3573297.1 terminase small subunit [Mesobacillus subterraneus]